MRIGLDFGTTNSSAALYQDGQITFVRSAATEASGILPSLIYITREHEAILGKAAAARYLLDDTGRPAIWKTKHAGIIDYWITLDLPSPLGGRVEPVRVTQDIYVQEDVGAKGRLLQSVKTALRNANYVGTAIFDRMYTIEELLTPILAELRHAAELTTGQPVDSVLLGRPVTFTHTVKGDARAEAILCRAANAAGFADVQFMAEPIAAAYSYHIRQPQRQTALVFDFGGGTLDLTVVRIGGDMRPEVLSTRGVLIGGDDFDRRIMEKFLFQHFAYEQPYEDDRQLSYEVYDYLLDWSRHPDLTRNSHYTKIKRAVHINKAGPGFAALLSLIDNKYGYQLFERIEQHKIALSERDSTVFQFEGLDINIRQPITRQAFNRAIRDYVAEMDRAVGDVLADAGVKPGMVDLALSTGGSSSVPAVRTMLAHRFGRERLQQHEQFLGVSSGLAVAAALLAH